MDADALIKLTRASAKEDVVRHAEVSIPEQVRVETVDEARALGYPDALQIDQNIRAGFLQVASTYSVESTAEAALIPPGGDRALFVAFREGQWDAVVTDDRKLLRLLQLLRVPTLTPCGLLAGMTREGSLTKERSLAHVEALRPLVSSDEHATARLALGALKGSEERR